MMSRNEDGKEKQKKQRSSVIQLDPILTDALFKGEKKKETGIPTEISKKDASMQFLNRLQVRRAKSPRPISPPPLPLSQSPRTFIALTLFDRFGTRSLAERNASSEKASQSRFTSLSKAAWAESESPKSQDWSTFSSTRHCSPKKCSTALPPPQASTLFRARRKESSKSSSRAIARRQVGQGPKKR